MKTNGIHAVLALLESDAPVNSSWLRLGKELSSRTDLRFTQSGFCCRPLQVVLFGPLAESLPTVYIIPDKGMIIPPVVDNRIDHTPGQGPIGPWPNRQPDI